MEAIEVWLGRLGLGHYAEEFIRNDVDLESLPSLNEQDLQQLGVSLGHRKKILKAIAEAATASAREPSGSIPHKPFSPTERRQVTVMFCDLVGSTPMSLKLDPEEFREVLRAYQNVCAQAVKRFGGYIAQSLGDGFMMYFGYPKAHEDDAQRAVRAGLEILSSIGVLDRSVRAEYGVEVAVRVGIHTGRVVTGTISEADTRADMAVVGDTPNVAARVQSSAQPNSVLASESTWRLLAGSFEGEDLGEHPLKGVATAQRLYRVLREARAEGRFEATHRTRLTPFVGREEEIGMLVGRWEVAKEGEGQVLALCGEPGIGKSRITRTLFERLGQEPFIRTQYQCTSFHTNTAFHPIADQLHRAAGFEDGESAAQRLDKLEGLLAHSGGAVPDALALFAGLLSIPSEGRFTPLALSPQRQKERTIEVLVDQMGKMSRTAPILMIFEDVHWIDPSTLELLNHLVPRVAKIRILALITHRPEFVPPWGGHAHVTLISLNRLSRGQCARLAARVAHKSLPEKLTGHIVDKTDGVPLFVEELTKAVLESNLVIEKEDRYELAGSVDELKIPATLHDSLMARLDRLMPMKEVAQIGAAIGREFSYELLAAVSPVPEVELKEALDKIVGSELVFQRGTPPHALYTFKHALVQDAAYDSLLKRSRQDLHKRIAQALEEKFPETQETQPELIAQHYTRADTPDQAIPYWLKAGSRALHSSALKECVDHLTQGLRLLLDRPESVERDTRELDFQAVLGTAQMMWKGYANKETGIAYRRADELLAKVGDSPQQFAVLWGVWAYYLVQPHYRQTHEAAQRALAVAERSCDNGLLVQALSLNCVTMWWTGRYAEAKTYTSRVREIYDESKYGSQVWVYNHDALNLCMIYESQYLWMMGYPDQAAKVDLERGMQARRLGHPFLTAFGDFWGGSVWHFRADQTRHEKVLHAVETLSREQGFPMWEAGAQLYQGWWLVHSGNTREGVLLIERAFAGWRATGAGNVGPYMRALLADAYSKDGGHERAAALIGEAVDHVDAVGERCHEAEVHRLRGDILMRGAPPGREKAEAAYREAIQIARKQEARGWELRASTSLAELLAVRGDKAAARDLLAPIYDWFTEGFDTRDLIQAKRLLDKLSA